MPRLIEAERLKADLRGLYELAGWGEREVHFSLADMDCNIDMEDSVEAIPIEFIEQYTYRHGLYTCAMEVISAWRAERKKNEID